MNNTHQLISKEVCFWLTETQLPHTQTNTLIQYNVNIVSWQTNSLTKLLSPRPSGNGVWGGIDYSGESTQEKSVGTNGRCNMWIMGHASHGLVVLLTGHRSLCCCNRYYFSTLAVFTLNGWSGKTYSHFLSVVSVSEQRLLTDCNEKFWCLTGLFENTITESVTLEMSV